MPVLANPRSRGAVPQAGQTINFGHPLATGLISAIVCNTGTAMVDLVKGIVGTSSGATAWSYKPVRDQHVGLGLLNASSGSTDMVGSKTPNLGPFSVAAFIDFALRDAGSHIVCANGSWACKASEGGSNVVTFVKFGVGNANSTITVPTGPTFLGFAIDASNSPTFFVNGTVQAVSQTSAPGAGTGDLIVGNRSQGGANDWLGCALGFVYVWNRQLSMAEFEALMVEPWAFFQPAVPHLRFWSLPLLDPTSVLTSTPIPPGLLSPAAWRRTFPDLAPTYIPFTATGTQTGVARIVNTVTAAVQTANSAVRNTSTAVQTGMARIDKDFSLTDPSFISWEDCKVNLTASPNAVGIDITQAAYMQIRKCNFSGGRYAIRGQRNPTGSARPSTYSVGVTIEDCIFGGQTGLSLCNPSILWRIINNIFNPGFASVANAIGNDGTFTASTEIVIDANYLGKASGGAYINLGSAAGFRVTGNFIDSLAVPAGVIVGDGSTGGVIEGNQIRTAVGVDCTHGTGSPQTGISIDGNSLGGNTPVLNYKGVGQQISLRGNAGIGDWDAVPQTVGGNVAVSAGGSGYRTAEGPDAKQGIVALVAGSKVVSNLNVTANSRIMLTSQSDGGTPGWLRVSARTPGVSFTITSSSASDTSTVAYEIFEPVDTPSTSTQNATGRVKQPAMTSVLTGTTRVGLTHTTIQTGVAKLAFALTVGQPGTARMVSTPSSAQPAVASISATAISVQPAKARLTTTVIAALTGLGRIRVTGSASQPGGAFIAHTSFQTGTAAVLNTATATQPGRAAVLKTATSGQVGKARIIDFDQTANQSGTTRIQTTRTATQTGTATMR